MADGGGTDEHDILAQPFLFLLPRRFPHLWKRCVEAGGTIYVPLGHRAEVEGAREEEIRESLKLVEEEGEVDAKGKRVDVKVDVETNEAIVRRGGCERRVRVLGEELYYPPGRDVGVRLVMVDMPLWLDPTASSSSSSSSSGTNGRTEKASTLSSMFGASFGRGRRRPDTPSIPLPELKDAYSCEEFLRALPHSAAALHNADNAISSFNSSYFIVDGYLKFCAKKVEKMSRALEASLRKALPAGSLYVEALSLACESYIVRGVHSKVYGILSSIRQDSDRKILDVLEAAAELERSGVLGIVQSCDVSGAAATLRSIHLGSCPLEKLNCLQMVHECINEGIKREVASGGLRKTISADDLLPLICKTLLDARPAHLSTDIMYLRLFHFGNVNKGKYDYYITTLTAALEYLNSETIDMQTTSLSSADSCRGGRVGGGGDYLHSMRITNPPHSNNKKHNRHLSADNLLGVQYNETPCNPPPQPPRRSVSTNDMSPASKVLNEAEENGVTEEEVKDLLTIKNSSKAPTDAEGAYIEGGGGDPLFNRAPKKSLHLGSFLEELKQDKSRVISSKTHSKGAL